MKRIIISGLILSLFLLLTACTQEKGGDASETSAKSPETPQASPEVETGAVSSDETPGEISIYLSPLPATKEQSLQAMITSPLDPPRYQWFVNGNEILDADGSELPSDYFSKGDEIRVVISKDENSGEASTFIANSPPRVTHGTVNCGLNIPIIPEVTDADGDELSLRYLWFINGFEAEHGENIITSEQVAAGDQVSLQISVSDGEMELPIFQCNEFTVPNMPPAFVSIPPSSFTGSLYQYQPVAEDPEGTRISYQLESAPEGMSIDSESALISWEVSAEDIGEHSVAIIATDEDGQQTRQDYTINLSLEGSP